MRKPGMTLRVGIAAATVAGTLVACTGPATAAVTIGQTAPGESMNCGDNFDILQPTVTSGNSYVVPATVATGTITSWSTDATGDAGNLTISAKVYRKVAGLPSRYQVVGHDGPRTLTPGAPNTFSASIPVKAGDFLGSSTPPGSQYDRCAFSAPGDSLIFRSGNLADGGEGDFTFSLADLRLNISAVVSPTNSFTLGRTTRNKRKGTATVSFSLPNPGQLTGSGGGAKVAGGAATSKAVPAGQATLVIRAKGKKKRKLNETGKVKVKPTITYTPTGGDPGAQQFKVKLRKKL